MAGKHVAFDIFIYEGKLVENETTETSLLPTLFGINNLLYRAFTAALKILSELGISEEEILSKMKRLHGAYNDAFIAVAEVRTVQLLHPDNLEKQKHFVDKVNAILKMT